MSDPRGVERIVAEFFHPEGQFRVSTRDDPDVPECRDRQSEPWSPGTPSSESDLTESDSTESASTQQKSCTCYEFLNVVRCLCCCCLIDGLFAGIDLCLGAVSRAEHRALNNLGLQTRWALCFSIIGCLRLAICVVLAILFYGLLVVITIIPSLVLCCAAWFFLAPTVLFVNVAACAMLDGAPARWRRRGLVNVVEFQKGLLFMSVASAFVPLWCLWNSGAASYVIACSPLSRQENPPSSSIWMRLVAWPVESQIRWIRMLCIELSRRDEEPRPMSELADDPLTVFWDTCLEIGQSALTSGLITAEQCEDLEPFLFTGLPGMVLLRFLDRAPAAIYLSVTIQRRNGSYGFEYRESLGGVIVSKLLADTVGEDEELERGDMIWNVNDSMGYQNIVELLQASYLDGLTLQVFRLTELSDGWESRETENGEAYFVNRALRRSQWSVPSNSWGLWEFVAAYSSDRWQHAEVWQALEEAQVLIHQLFENEVSVTCGCCPCCRTEEYAILEAWVLFGAEEASRSIAPAARFLKAWDQLPEARQAAFNAVVAKLNSACMTLIRTAAFRVKFGKILERIPRVLKGPKKKRQEDCCVQ